MPERDAFTAANELREQFEPLFADSGGIDSWLVPPVPHEVVDRLTQLDASPLSLNELNQLLILSHEAGVSSGFYQYYWTTKPRHTYDVAGVPGFDSAWVGSRLIASTFHLYWGLYRFYIDALLYFGNVRSAYRYLRDLSHDDLAVFFTGRRYPTDALRSRGPALPLRAIARDDRYLISETACKTLVPVAGSEALLKSELVRKMSQALEAGKSMPITIRRLLHETPEDEEKDEQGLLFSAGEFADEAVESVEELHAKYARYGTRFESAREAALKNTELYLSMVHDLDVYVATSMRARDDFRQMADFCEVVFQSDRLAPYQIRHFDPTLSAAAGHQDKGLIECLMVKSAKALIYCAGVRDSYGKDAEAAMALSLGKPVIFYCEKKEQESFLRDTHPLSRLIDFQTGVAVGAMVTTSTATVSELLARAFENGHQYEIKKRPSGYLCLHEKLTDSVVRLQTDDKLLLETFWNYYHRTDIAT